MYALIEKTATSRRRKAARRELGNLHNHTLRDIGIERDQVDTAVEGLIRADRRARRRETRTLSPWRRLLGISRLAAQRTACDTG